MGMYDQNSGYNTQGGGCSSRILVALAIAAVGLFMYFSNVQENPVTGEKQHIAISPSQEIRLGLESAPQMAQEMGGEVSSSDPRAVEVSKIGNFLVDNTVAKKSPWQFKFHLLADEKTVNAFALPGGQIFITLGLFNKLQTEAQLAGVLAHEMGHVIERHSAEQMAKSRLGQMFVVAVGAGAGGDQRGGYDATMIAAVVNQMFQLRYSRKDESEADQWGLKLMEQVGYDPKAMIQVMEVLKSVGGKAGPEMFQTHPNPDLRIQQIKEYLAAHPPKDNLNEGKNLQEMFKGQTSTQESNSLFDLWR